MSFIKLIIGLPLIIVIAVFAFINNEMINFDFWPFNFNVSISQSIATVVMILLGYIIGKLDSWISYAPLRKALRCQLRQNKKLNVQQQKLNEEVKGLKGTLDTSKAGLENFTTKPSSAEKLLEKTKNKITNLFKSKPQEPKQDDNW